jgi:hypothetical protein
MHIGSKHYFFYLDWVKSYDTQEKSFNTQENFFFFFLIKWTKIFFCIFLLIILSFSTFFLSFNTQNLS